MDFIQGFYASISILNILKGSLQRKLKGANVWPFNERGKVATGGVCHIWSLYWYCKENIDQSIAVISSNFYVPGRADAVFRLDLFCPTQ